MRSPACLIPRLMFSLYMVSGMFPSRERRTEQRMSGTAFFFYCLTGPRRTKMKCAGESDISNRSFGEFL